MSNTVLPVLPGMTFPVTKTPMWKTNVQPATSGKETRLSYWSYPKWKWSLPFDVLRSGAQAELQTLLGFFNARQGSFDSFLFDDPDDNTIANQALGIGDGANTQFQLARAMGGYLEPVTSPKTPPIVTISGQNANLLRNPSFEVQAGGNRPSGWAQYNNAAISTAYVAAPARSGSFAFGLKANAATTDTFGVLTNAGLVDGSIVGGIRGRAWEPNTTFTVSFYAKKVNGAGFTTMTPAFNTAPASVTAVANPTLTTSYQRYVFTIQWGASVEANGALAITRNGTTATNDELHIDDVQVVYGSSAVPFALPTSLYSESYYFGANGLLIFEVAPPNAAAIAWSGTYYWRVRFLDDQIEASKFMRDLWELRALQFQSVK